MSNYSGYCRKCIKFFELPKEFHEVEHFGVCPECQGNLILDRHSLEENKQLLGLAKSEIGDKVAGIKPQ